MLLARVLRRCIEERLVGGEGFAVDASLIKADANRQKGIEGDKGLPPNAAGRAIDEYLGVLDDAAFGAATEVTPKFVSPSDPAARWTGALHRRSRQYIELLPPFSTVSTQRWGNRPAQLVDS